MIRIGPLLATVLLTCAGAACAADEVAVQRIKAAFLYKFASYVEWPEQAFAAAESPIVIGIFDADDIAEELRTVVAGRRVGERLVEVEQVERLEGRGGRYQILFVGGATDRGRVGRALALVEGHPVLTVTDARSGHPNGSIINFLDVSDRVRFDISLAAADRNGLRLRAQLLSVAREVVSQ